MIFYWVLFFFPAYKALTNPLENWNKKVLFIIVGALSIFIGLRFQVGPDWNNYLKYFNNIKNIQNIFLQNEFFFGLLNYFASKLNLGVYGVNLFSGFIFSSGLIFFCKSLKRQWLALTISIPYIVIAVSMGYTRQSISLGILMFGIVYLSRGKKLLYFILTIVSSLFQLTSLICLFLLVPFLIDSRKIINRIFYVLLGSLFLGFIFEILISRFLILYIQVYLEEGMSSSGVFIRLGMVSIPSILYILLGSRLSISDNERIIWKWISFYSLSLIPLLFLISSTTVIDRLSLYALPIMIFVMSNLPELRFLEIKKNYLNLSVVSLSFLLQFVWLNFASNSAAWIPYRNILFN